MLVTKATEYALLSLMLIAQKNTPQDVDTLSKQLDISKSFLAKILQNLAKNGILNSYKGAHGGFVLAKKPSELTIKKILECVEKKPTVVFECSVSYQDCPTNKADICKIRPFFNNFQNSIDTFLEGMTLEDILK